MNRTQKAFQDIADILKRHGWDKGPEEGPTSGPTPDARPYVPMPRTPPFLLDLAGIEVVCGGKRYRLVEVPDDPAG